MWQHKLMESSLPSVSAMSAVIGSFIRNFLKWEMLPDMYLGIFNFDAASITRVTGVCMYAVSETGFVEALSGRTSCFGKAQSTADMTCRCCLLYVIHVEPSLFVV